MSRPAPLWRRFVRAVFWLCAGCLVMAIAATAGLIDLTPYRPPTDWFFTEWILQAWIDEPLDVLAAPFVVIASSAVLQTAASALSVDPALRLLGLSVVDRGGFSPVWWQWVLRLVGLLLSWATLGFGFALCWVSRHGRSLEDLISSTALVLEDDE